MLNILSYLGMSVQSEVCLWTLLGLMRTIFDATLFKVNANLKQVWQMTMPLELTLPVQRVLRTMISGVMLVQCFTLYVYLAAYIVLLYPVFLEERPNLVLPWLLLAAIRKLLCELLSMAMGLGVCVLLGPARPPCIRFVVIKFVSIMPAFYMWLLMFSYYHSLKMNCSYKSFAPVHNKEASDFGLELAVRRRRTKSLLDEDQLRKKLITNFYHEESVRPVVTIPSSTINTSDTGSIQSTENILTLNNVQMPNSVPSNRLLAEFTGEIEGMDPVVPRNVDRILEQFILMMLKIGTFLNKRGIDPVSLLSSSSLPELQPPGNNGNDNNISFPPPYTELPQDFGGSTNVCTATYMKNYPHIFDKKKTSDSGLNLHTTDQTLTMLPIVDKSKSVAVSTNSKICRSKQCNPVHYTAKSKTPSTSRAIMSCGGVATTRSIEKTNKITVSQTQSKSFHSTLRTQSKSPSEANNESFLKPKDISESSYHNNPTSSMSYSAGNIGNTNTATTTQITDTKSIAISLLPSITPREHSERKEHKYVKYHRNKNNITVDSPSSTPFSTDVTITREDLYESNLTMSSNSSSK